MSAGKHTACCEVISWDICQNDLSDGSSTFDVVGTSDSCKVTLHCVDLAAAERLVTELNGLSGAVAEAW
jgi:hypothetical protein